MNYLFAQLVFQWFLIFCIGFENSPFLSLDQIKIPSKDIQQIFEGFSGIGSQESHVKSTERTRELRDGTSSGRYLSVSRGTHRVIATCEQFLPRLRPVTNILLWLLTCATVPRNILLWESRFSVSLKRSTQAESRWRARFLGDWESLRRAKKIRVPGESDPAPRFTKHRGKVLILGRRSKKFRPPGEPSNDEPEISVTNAHKWGGKEWDPGPFKKERRRNLSGN